MTEIVEWRNIKGYEGYYQVSNYGQVRSVDRTLHVKDGCREYDKKLLGKHMRQYLHSNGYKVVPLTKDGVCETLFVHRLVAEAFIPNVNQLPFINHKDEDKTNNCYLNLEWCTCQYNNSYGNKPKRHSRKMQGRKLTEEHKHKISESIRKHYCDRAEPKESEKCR
jgi:hypothetical protein